MAKTLADIQSQVVGRPLALEPRALRHVLAGLQSTPSPEAFFGGLDALMNVHQVAGDVSIVHVRGSLMKGFAWDDYADIRAGFDAALANGGTRAVLLEVDSPGGIASSSLYELADHVFESRSTKPIYAIACDQATSASYLIASAASKVFMAPQAVVGSIGSIAVHVDQSRHDAARGLTFTEVTSGARKNELSPHSPLSDGGRDTLERMVAEVTTQFVAAVSRYRGLSAAAIRSQEAAIYFASDAQSAGLVDGVLSYDAALAKIRSDTPTTEDTRAAEQARALYAAAANARLTVAQADAIVTHAGGVDQALQLIQQRGAAAYQDAWAHGVWDRWQNR